MKYSIIIISKDNRDYLTNGLESLLKSVPKNLEIIIVEASDILEELSVDGNIKHIRIPKMEAGFSAQRNLGVKNATGEYIIFIDDDEEITNDWFENLTRVIKENKEIAGAMGTTFPIPKNANIISFSEGVMGHPGGGFRFHNFSKGKVISISQVTGCNMILKKSVIEEAGYFDFRNFHGGEDTDLGIRITKKFGVNQFRYIPNALLWHYSKTNFFDMCRWYLRRGIADAELFLKHTVHIKYLISTSVILKILPVMVLSFIFNWMILPGAFFIWYFLQISRTRFMFSYFYPYNFSSTKKIITFLLFPFIKLTADIMFDFGRIKRIVNISLKRR